MNSNPDFDVELAFEKIYEKLKKIKDTETFSHAHELIKKTVSLLDKVQKEECFSVTYVRKVPSYEPFLQALEIKARDATGIVPSISSCKFKHKQLMGFVRTIKIGDHEAIQEVWENKGKNSYKVIYNSEGINFIATNELDRDEDQGIFTALYCVYKHPKYKTADWFLKQVMDPTFENLIQLSSDKNLSDRYKALVSMR